MNDSVSFSNCAINLPQVLGANTGWMLVITVMTNVVISRIAVFAPRARFIMFVAKLTLL
jgi:hypothetical protein